MEFSSSAANGRRAAVAARNGFFHGVVFLVLGLLAAFWSAGAAAQSCDFVTIGTTSQSAAPNGTVTFTMQTQTACNATSTVNLAIAPGDSTNGAAIVGPANVTTTLDTDFNFNVTLGPDGGGTGQVIATCISADCAGDIITFDFATNSTFVYTANGATTFNAIQEGAFQLSTALDIDGAPGTLDSVFSTGSTVSPDAAGIATTTTSRFVTGLFTPNATLDCSAGPAGCGAVPAVTWNVTIEHPTVSNVTPLAVTAEIGEVVNLTVLYDGDLTGVPAPDGDGMFWSATPFGGTLTGNNVAGGAGEATATFSAAAPGVYTVSANSGCTSCGVGQFLSFTVTVIDRQLSIEQGDGQAGTVGVDYAQNIMISAADDDGTTTNPAVGVGINWVVTAAGGATATLSSPSTVTNGSGESEITVTPTSAGTITIDASRADDPTAVVTFTLTAAVGATPTTTTPVTANPATIDEGVPTAFTVNVDQAGPLAGATVNWVSNDPNLVVSGPTSVTNAGGDASINVTGNFPGTYLGAITASVDPDAVPASGDESSFSFDVTVNPALLLNIENGDGQTGVVGTAFTDDLIVYAEDSTGTASVGVTINWTVTSGSATLGTPVPTDASGESPITVTPTGAGPIQITAERADAPGVTVTFNLTATAVPVTMTAVTADPANGFDGVAQTFTIDMDQAGIPVAGATVTWTTTGPFTTSAPTSVSAANGEASIDATGTGTGTFTNAVTATVDVDGVAGTGDEASYSFDVILAGSPTLVISQGQGGTANPGANFPLLEITAQNGGLPAGGITINWTLVSGSATIAPGGATTFTGGNADATVTAGAVPGPVVITAERSDVPGLTVTFNLTINAVATTTTAVTADPASLTLGTPTVFTVNVQQGGGPLAGATVNWSAIAGFTLSGATSVTDVNGDASITVTGNSAGSFAGAVTAAVDPDGTAASGDESSHAFNVDVATVPGLTINGGNGQTGTAGTAFPLPLSVLADDSGTPTVGLTINWAVTGGSATIVPGGATDAAGQAQATVTPTASGAITITATRSDAPAVLVTFNLNAGAAGTTTTAVTADPAALDLGVPTVFTVNVQQGGGPLAGTTVNWSAIAGFTLSGATSVTDVNGDANITVTGNSTGSFAGAVTASVDPDAIAASGDESSHAFNVDVATVPTLVINGGNGQTCTVGTNCAQVLSVIADDSGTPTVGLLINWSVLSGSATFVPSGNTDAVGEAHASVTPTAPGPFQIRAARSDDPTVLRTFNLTAVAAKTLTAVTPNPASGTVGTAMTFTVDLDQGGVPQVGQTITWTASAPFTAGTQTGTTDAAGESSVTLTPNTAGNFPTALTAVYDPDGIPANGNELTVTFAVNTAVVRTLTIVSGDGQTTTAGTSFPLPLDVIAEDSGTPVAGLLINWSLVSGSAVVDDAPLSNGGGHSTASITASAPGPIQIRAERSDDPTATVLFNLNAVAAPYALVAVSANPATGTVNIPIPVTVELTQGGTPVTGATVTWSTTGPFATSAGSSTTDGSGQATVDLTGSTAGSFANALTATFDPDGIPANGDEVTVTYGAQITFVASLAITGGDNQSALPGTTFATLLEVHASNSGVAAAGVGINWTFTGDVSVSPFGPTDAAGNASATVTAGTTPGAVTVTATRADDATVFVQFNLTVSALGTLTITGGDGQVLAAGVASDPLEVELRDGSGVVIAGAVVSWSTTAGTLASATSTTNAAGIATNTVTASVPGAVQVTASSPLAAAPVTFALNGALGNLVGLNPVQQEIVDAIDNLCPALAQMGTLTPEQADLLARCEELIDAGGIDPDATIVAIDELMTDVALAQGNASMAAAQAQFQNLKTRIAALRSGTVGTSFGGLALNTSTGPVSMDTLSTAFAAAEDPAAGPTDGTEIGADFSKWGFFAAGNIGRGESDEGSINPEYDYDIEGITLGVDYRHSDKWIFGAAFGYTRQDTGLPGDRGSVDTTGWSLSAYTTYYQADSWYVDGVVTWGRNDFGLIRRIDYTVPTPGGGTSTISQEARSDSSGDLLSTGFTVGRDFNRGALGIGPYARLLYTRLGFDEINEELLPGVPGSGLGLSVEERELTSLASVIGAKFTYTYSTDWGVVIPHLQLEWEHEFKDDPQSLQARFLNDPTMTPIVVTGDRLDTNYFRLGLGLSMVLTKGRSGFLYYEHLFGRNGTSQYNLALGLRLEF